MSIEPPLSHRIGRWFLDRWVASQRRKRLNEVRFEGLPAGLSRDLPTILVSNHCSWWDGFLLLEVQRSWRPGQACYSIMLERERRKHRGLKPLTLGIKPGSASSVRAAFREAQQLRGRHGAALTICYFPQGKIWPSTRRPLGFQSGIRLLAKLLAPVQILPVGIHEEPLNTPDPNFFVGFGEPIRLNPDEELDIAALELSVTSVIDRILSRLHREGEAVLTS